MPVKQSLEDLELRWRRASSAYAHTVITHGSGTPEAKEAWRNARVSLDAVIESKADVFKAEAEARAAEVAAAA